LEGLIKVKDRDYSGLEVGRPGEMYLSSLETDAEGEIDDDTLNLKVRETLNQIGADVENFDEE